MNKWQRKWIKVNIPEPSNDEKNQLKHFKENYTNSGILDSCLGSAHLWMVKQGIKMLLKEGKATARTTINDSLLKSFKDEDTDFERVKLFVKYGADFSNTMFFREEFIHAPVNVLQFLFDEYKVASDPENGDNVELYQDILKMCSRYGKIDTVKYLLEGDKCDASWFTGRAGLGVFMAMSDALPDMLPLLEEKGFDFEARKTGLLLCGLATHNDALTGHVLYRFSALEKDNLCMEDFASIESHTSGLIGLLDEYGILPKDHKFHSALNAAANKDIETLETLVKQDGVDINSNGSAILIKALKTGSCSFVDAVYELGGRFEKVATYAAIKQAVKMSSYPFLENVSELDNADSTFDMILDLARNANYIKRVLELWGDYPMQKLGSLFEKAVDKESLTTVQVLVDAGLDLKQIDSQTVCGIVRRSESPDFIDKLKDMGLGIEENVKLLMDNCDDKAVLNGMYRYLKNINDVKLTKEYPRWEKQDDNTVAELSFVRKTDQKGFLRLRRAFNFRAGLVDQCYETCSDDNIIDFKPADTLLMSTLPHETINTARKELEDRDGFVSTALRQEAKVPKSLRPGKSVTGGICR